MDFYCSNQNLKLEGDNDIKQISLYDNITFTGSFQSEHVYGAKNLFCYYNISVPYSKTSINFYNYDKNNTTANYQIYIELVYDNSSVFGTAIRNTSDLDSASKTDIDIIKFYYFIKDKQTEGYFNMFIKRQLSDEELDEDPEYREYKKLLISFLVPTCIGAALLITGVVILIVCLVKRRNRKRQATIDNKANQIESEKDNHPNNKNFIAITNQK